MFGLIEYYAATRDAKVKTFIKKLADGLIAMQDGDMNTFPYGLHRSWQTMWHMWGNGQTQALAAAGKRLNDKKLIRSAEREAKGWYTRLLVEGFRKELDVTHTSKTLLYEQIAYGVRPLTVGLLRLYEATKNSDYLKMAGLEGSWLFGNNVLHQVMYDTATGRCYDGIRDSVSLNKNSGAESTIEALNTLVELEHYPLARKYLGFQKTQQRKTSKYVYAVFQNSSHDELVLVIDTKEGRYHLLEGDEAKMFYLNQRW